MALALLLLAGGMLSLAATGAGAKGAKAKVEFKLATLAPEGSTWMRIMDDLDTEIRQRTNGEAGLKVYPGGIQGDETVVLRKVRSGQLHGGGFTGVGLGEIAPGVRVLEAPFLFETLDEVHAVRESMGPTFEKVLRDAGWELLGWADVGFVYLFAKEPMRGAQDLKRTRMWLWEGDPLAETFLKNLGVSPVPLPITDVVTSLQTGLIDAVYTSPYACIALQWFTRLGTMTDVPVTHAIGAVVVSRKQFEKLSSPAQSIVKESAKTHFARLAVETERENEESLHVLREKGIALVAAADADRAGFHEIGRRVREELIGVLYTREILEGTVRALDAYRARRSSKGP